MQNVTLTIAVVVCLLVLFLRPTRAYLAYMAILMWYPYFLVVNLGTLDISAGRIVITVLLLRCFVNPNIRRNFRWSRFDTWITCSMAVYVTMYCFTRPLIDGLENRAGYLMDTWLIYLATRFCITSRADVISIIKGIAIICTPLALFGVLESVIGWQPYIHLRQYCPWRQDLPSYEPRWGLKRALGPNANPIPFGMAFATFLPMVYWLRYQMGPWKKWAYLFTGVLVVGTLSSMSSGPVVMLIVICLCLVLEYQKQLIKPILIFAAFSIVFVAIASNRSFYHVIAEYADPVGGSGWHRARLIDCAIKYFDQWYLVGYGGEDPGWGQDLGGFANTDVTNEFIIAGVRYGILGVVAFCWVLVAAMRLLIRQHNTTRNVRWQSWTWALCTTLVALIIVLNTVGLLAHMGPVFYAFMAIIGAAPQIAPRKTTPPATTYQPGPATRLPNKSLRSYSPLNPIRKF